MSSEPTPSRLAVSATERHRHDLRGTLTAMRLQTQLLQRLARRLEGPEGEQLVRGLAQIDEGISTVVRQLDQPPPD